MNPSFVFSRWHGRHSFWRLVLRFSGTTCASLAAVAGCWAGGPEESRRCATDTDCLRDEVCLSAGAFSQYPTCEPGCRSDADCGSGERCSPDALCGTGCNDDADCGGDEICHHAFVINLGRSRPGGDCRPGCRADGECAAGDVCVCAECTAGCRADSDCGEHAYCAGLGVFSCEPPRCEPLPEAVPCGATTCEGRLVGYPAGRTLVEPCCADPLRGVCGLDVGFVGSLAPSCQAEAQPGTVDPGCPAIADAFGVSYPGCRRLDGSCGTEVDAVLTGAGVGCASLAL